MGKQGSRRGWRGLGALVLTLACGLWTPGAWSASIEFIKPLPGKENSGPHSLSANASVVVGWSGSNNGPDDYEAYRWTEASGTVGLGFLPGHYLSIAEDVSADGSVVVGRSEIADGSSAQAFRWTDATGMVGLGHLPGYDTSQALAVSADGSVVVGIGGFIWNAPGEAFRWTEATGMVGLGHLPGDDASGALAVSADGSVVVGVSGSVEGGFEEVFRWTEATGMVGLGFLPGHNSSESAFAYIGSPLSADGALWSAYGRCPAAPGRADRDGCPPARSIPCRDQ